MAFNTGLSFISNSGLASGGADLFGDPGAFGSKSTVDGHIADNKVAFVDCNGANTCLVIPMLKLSGSDGSGSNPALIQVYGIIGFGEPGQSDYETSGKFFFNLGTSVICTVSSGTTAAASTQAVIQTPTGVEFTHMTGGGTGAASDNSDPFIVSDVIAAATTAAGGPDVTDLADVNIGYTHFTGIGIFQQLALVYNIGSAKADSLGNAITCLRY